MNMRAEQMEPNIGSSRETINSHGHDEFPVTEESVGCWALIEIT